MMDHVRYIYEMSHEAMNHDIVQSSEARPYLIHDILYHLGI